MPWLYEELLESFTFLRHVWANSLKERIDRVGSKELKDIETISYDWLDLVLDLN